MNSDYTSTNLNECLKHYYPKLSFDTLGNGHFFSWRVSYLCYNNSKWSVTSLTIIDRFFRRFLGYFPETHLKHIFKSINLQTKEIKDAFPLPFLKHIQGLWKKTYPSEKCPYLLPLKTQQSVTPKSTPQPLPATDKKTQDRQAENPTTTALVPATPKYKMMVFTKENPFLVQVHVPKTLELLNSHYTEEDKKKGLLNKYTEFTNDKEDLYPYVKQLAQTCPKEHLSTVLHSFKVPETMLLSKWGPAEKLGREFMITILESKDPERIRAAFSGYWTDWKSFDRNQPPLSKKLLILITDEVILNAVLDAIPATLSEEQKDKIYHLLQNKHSFEVVKPYATYHIKEELIPKVKEHRLAANNKTAKPAG